MGNKKVYLDDKYEVVGLFGCWLKSYENGVEHGHVRYIGNKLMYACYVYKKRFRKNEISWVAIEMEEKYCMEDIRAWVARL